MSLRPEDGHEVVLQVWFSLYRASSRPQNPVAAEWTPVSFSLSTRKLSLAHVVGTVVEVSQLLFG